MSQDKYAKARLAYNFFCHKTGESVSIQEIMDNTGWARSSVRTYFTKKWNGFVLEQIEPNMYEVCVPCDLSEQQFVEHHSQIDDDIKY